MARCSLDLLGRGLGMLLAIDLLALAPPARAQCDHWDYVCDVGADGQWQAGDLQTASNTRLADRPSDEACAALVRSSEPTASGASWSAAADSPSGDDECWAEFGTVTGRSGTTYSSCAFQPLGPSAVAPRDVTFLVGGAKFHAAGGEEWGVGQLVLVTEKSPGGGDCAGADGTYKVSAVDGNVITVAVINGALAETSPGNNVNSDCQIAGTTNLATENGIPCYACPAGKEPLFSGADGTPLSSCADCYPGEYSDDRGTCHQCTDGTSWGNTAILSRFAVLSVSLTRKASPLQASSCRSATRSARPIPAASTASPGSSRSRA